MVSCMDPYMDPYTNPSMELASNTDLCMDLTWTA